jgi:hypothetical protein
MTVTGYTKAKIDALLAALTSTVAGKADTSSLAPVATAGTYAALTGKPTIPTVPGDIGAQPAGDYATNTALTTGLAGKVNSSTYTAGLAGKQDVLPTAGSYTYNGDGTVATDPDGNSYTYNSDGTVHTITKGGATRTATYNADLSIASWT